MGQHNPSKTQDQILAAVVKDYYSNAFRKNVDRLVAAFPRRPGMKFRPLSKPKPPPEKNVTTLQELAELVLDEEDTCVGDWNDMGNNYCVFCGEDFYGEKGKHDQNCLLEVARRVLSRPPLPSEEKK